jgi:hypothetical protein
MFQRQIAGQAGGKREHRQQSLGFIRLVFRSAGIRDRVKA